MSKAMIAEVSVEISDKAWTLRLDMNALAEFEEATGQNALEAIEAFETGEVSIVKLRHLIWASLKYHHPDVTLAQAGDVISHDPEALTRALAEFMPKADDPGVAEGKSRGKKKAAAG
ncbi:gene transfer agent family protein [Mameliella alba]|nr:gene transfer agent family protein [Mameliella alba]MBY6168504.1 gene transfer agent family protein [Mameliella alba]MBY6173523.1 gene transfer agent family protein [Mameliella alba]